MGKHTHYAGCRHIGPHTDPNKNVPIERDLRVSGDTYICMMKYSLR